MVGTQRTWIVLCPQLGGTDMDTGPCSFLLLIQSPGLAQGTVTSTFRLSLHTFITALQKAQICLLDNSKPYS